MRFLAACLLLSSTALAGGSSDFEVTATPDYYTVIATPISTYPFTMAIWFNMESEALMTPGGYLDDAASDQKYMQILNPGDQTPIAHDKTLSSTDAADLALNTWYLMVVSYEASAIDGYIAAEGAETLTAFDSQSKGANTYGGPDSPTVGAEIVGGFDNAHFDGELAHFALWDRTLSTAEMDLLLEGSPRLLLDGLVGYWPLQGAGGAADAVDITGGNDLSASSTPTEDPEGPPVRPLMPRGQ